MPLPPSSELALGIGYGRLPLKTCLVLNQPISLHQLQQLHFCSDLGKEESSFIRHPALSMVFLFLRPRNFHQINSCKKPRGEGALSLTYTLTANPSSQVCLDPPECGPRTEKRWEQGGCK